MVSPEKPPAAQNRPHSAMPLLTAGFFLQAHAVATYTLSRQIVYKEKRSNENKGRTMNDCTESYEESRTFNPESNEKEHTAARRREHNGFPLASFAHADIRPSAPGIIEGVIFDLDGTLLDSMPWWENLGENYLISRGKTPAHDIRHHFKRLTLEGSARYMKEEYGLEESIAEISAGILAGIEHAYRDSIPLKPGVIEMLEAFSRSGVRMCVATATEHHCAQAALERLEVLHYFSAVFTCSEVGASKTEPLIFDISLAHLETPCETTFVMEDSLHAIETARRAGFPTIAVHEAASASDEAAIRRIADVYLDSFGLKA